MQENIRTQVSPRNPPASRAGDPGRHFSGHSVRPREDVGDLLLRAADSRGEAGLRAEHRDGALDVMLGVHTSFLVGSGAECNKETCHASHKAAGIIGRIMTIASNLKRLRKAAGLSQTGLADLSGVSQQLISQIESGANVTTKYLPALATALQCKVTEIDENYVGVYPEDPFVDRYLALTDDDRKFVQSVIARLDRS